jgi:xylose isomerase
MKKTAKSKFDYLFDFTLLLNDKIICQRNFDIRDYNHNCQKSLEIKEMISEVIMVIESQLKNKSLDYLWESYNPFTPKIIPQINSEKIRSDLFKLNISMNSEIMVSGCFDGCKYPPKIRYQVDIKPLVPILIEIIRLYASSDEYDVVTVVS